MKIVFFASYYLPYLSGITVYPQLLLRALLENYEEIEEITVLTFKHDYDLPSDEVSFELSEQTDKPQNAKRMIRVVRMPYLFKVSKGFISPQSIYYFLKYALRADVVFLNIPNAEGVGLAFLARLLGKKIVSIFHCQVFLGQSFFKRIIEKVLLCSVYLQLFLSDKITVYTLDYFQSLPVSNFFAKKVVQILPPVKRLTPDHDLSRDLVKKKKNQTWIGFVGRIAAEKGLDNLSKAMMTLKKDQDMDDFNPKLVLIGPYGNDVVGESKYYQQIKQQLEASQVDFEFVGKKMDSELASFYHVLDCLVLPSINQTEAFGLVQVEAMQQQVPVIAANLPGVRVPVKKSQFGRIVTVASVESLVQAIKEVMINRENLIQKQEKKRKKFVNQFSPEQTAKKYFQLIQKI